ncbi:MAG: sugar phosphate isomerase/epimerase family protein [Clostridia bacterium]
MKIGAQLYTVRDLCKTAGEFSKTLHKLYDIGYRDVQISAINLPPDEIRKICDDAGMKVVITHSDPGRILNETAAVIEEHRRLGCNYVGIGALPAQYERNEEGIKRFTEDFNKAGRILKENGMSFHYHNHSFEMEKTNGKIWFDRMIEESDPEVFFFILDVYWIQHGGLSPVEYINKLGNRIKVLHYKDMAIREWKQKFASVGSGNLNWKEILSVSRQNHIPYAMVEQDADFIDDPVSELARSFHFLKEQC